MNPEKAISSLEEAGWFDNFSDEARQNLKKSYASNFQEGEFFPIHMAQTIGSYYKNFGDDEFTRSVTEDIESAGGGDFKFENYSQELIEEEGKPQLKISFDLSGKHYEKLIDTSRSSWQYFPFMNGALKTVGLRIFECGLEDPYALGSINSGEEIYTKKLAFRCVPACGSDFESEGSTEIKTYSDVMSVLERIGWFECFSEKAKRTLFTIITCISPC